MSSARIPSPVAVSGIGCRLPGAASFDALVEASLAGRDAVGRPPPWRGFEAVWHPEPGRPGRTYCIEGGFLEQDLREVDAGAFDLSPREASELDPQQRLLLEVVWEAIEHACIAPRELSRLTTGVYVGMSGSEFKVLAQRRGPEHIGPYIGTGVHAGAAAGRLAYVLGLSGPAVAVDTACSSGLVALHEACVAIGAGLLDVAIVAAVNALLDPEASVAMATMGTLSRSGRCRTFSAAADGYVRAEGCVAAVLVRSELAGRPGAAPLAWILGTAANQDGRSNGLTSPSGSAQQAVIRAALAASGVRPEQIAYHEAHGSATALGDAVELGALDAVHRGRRAPLPTASIKSRIGHLEAAAGLAGLAQAVGVLRTGRVFPGLHADPPAEALRAAASLRVPEAPEALDGELASVSSFGIGGTNAHAVLRRAEEATGDPGAAPRLALFALSARSEPAIELLREETAEALRASEDWAGACATAMLGRAHREVRLAVVASTAAEAAGALLGAAPVRTDDPARVAFLFPGQGASPGTGALLYAAGGAYREAVDAALAPLAPADREAALRLLAAGVPGEVGQRIWQPAVFALSWGLAALLDGFGVQPVAVAGHSSGEVAAAALAGVLSLEDAVGLVVQRGELLDRSGPGGMAAVFAPEEDVRAALGEGSVGIAAVNHPGETVISGPPAALEEAIAALAARGLSVRPLKIGTAGHSALLDPLLPELRAPDGAPPRLRWVSTRTGAGVDGAPSGEHWRRQLREPVRFGAAVAALAAEGVDTFVDLGPHPTLAAAAAAVAPSARTVGLLSRDLPADRAVIEGIAALWRAGADLDPEALADGRRVRARLPSTPFLRRRLWLPGAVEPEVRSAALWRVAWEPREPVRAPTGPVSVSGSEALAAALAERGVRVEDGASVRVAVAPESDDPLVVASWARELLGGAVSGATVPRICLAVTDRAAHAAAVGLARAARLEHPALGASVAFLGPDRARDADTVVAALALPGEEVRSGGEGSPSVARLVPFAGDSAPFSTGGRWVITGGFGALGMHTAAWLAAAGARRLALVGRRGAGPEARPGIERLRAAGVEVEEVAADVSAPGVARTLLAGDDLAGVIHATGVLRDEALHAITDEALAATMAPKALAARALAEALADRPEVRLVLYASFAGVVGGRGQGSYAAANAVLDAIARERRAAGGRALSVAFGPWAGEGMAAPTLGRRVREGLPPMAAERALAALGRALGADEPAVAVVDLEPEAIRAAIGGAVPLLAGCLGAREGSGPLPAEGRWLDHAIGGSPLVSAADQIVWAMREAGPRLRRVRIEAPLALPARITTAAAGGRASVESESGVHLVAEVPSDATGSPVASLPLAELRARCAEPLDPDALYASFEARGLIHGPAYRHLGGAWRGDGEVLARVVPSGPPGPVLDACLVTTAFGATGEGLLLPTSVEAIEGDVEALRRAAWVRCRAREVEDGVRSDVDIADEEGRVLLSLRGHALRRVAAARPRTGQLRARALAAPLSERAVLIEAWIASEAGRVLGLDAPAPIDRDLSESGFDSIMAVELRNVLAAEDFDVPLHLVVGGRSPREIAAAVAAALPAPEAAPAPAADDRAGEGTAPALPAGTLGSHAVAAFIGAIVGAGLWVMAEALAARWGG